MNLRPHDSLRAIAGLTLVLIVAALFFPLNLPSDTRVAAYLGDLLHLPSMALATGCVFALLARVRGPARRAVLAAGGTAVLALAVEWFQPFWGRERGAADIAWGFAGAGLAAAGLAVRHAGGPRARRAYALLAAIVLAAALTPLSLFAVDRMRAGRAFPLLAGFEDGLELGRWDAKGVRVVRVPDHAVQGRWAALVEVTDVDRPYPGLFLVEGPRDWTPMRAWCTDLYWPDGQAGELWIRVDDRGDSPRYGDRFQKMLVLRPGAHRICIGRDEMTKTPSGRELDLHRVTRCGLFLHRARVGDYFYMDNMRLETGSSRGAR